MNWYIDVLKKYTEFSGRAQRKEYWMFFLFHFIFSIVSIIADEIIGTSGIIIVLYNLGVLLPYIGVSIRRLHDTGRSGWWMLVGLIPAVGGIILLILLVQDSKPGENQFGPNPKENSA